MSADRPQSGQRQAIDRNAHGDRYAHVITVDVEEYFHPNAMDDAVAPESWEQLPSRFETNTRRVLQLLEDKQTRATFFVLGWVAERAPSLVREIVAGGHEVACHGYAHRLVYRLGRDAFREDVRRGKRVLEDIVGAPVEGFRAASYSVVSSTLWALDVLLEEGFVYDSSIFPVQHDIYGIPDFPRFPSRLRCAAGEIVEIPPSTVRMLGRNWPVAGGGYLRMLPWWMTRSAIQRIQSHDEQAAVVYLHPWELDPDQPRLPAGVLSRLRQYSRLGTVPAKLDRLLDEFSLAPIRDVISFADLPLGPVVGAPQ